jgi:hypothetical protein
MARYAQVLDAAGITVNVIIWDGNTDPQTGGWEPPTGYTMVPLADDQACAAGWTYDGTTFVPPPGGEAPVVAQE